MNSMDYTIRGVLFDFDGTLTRPGALDFKKIKAALGCPTHLPLLEYIDGLDDDIGQILLGRLNQFEIKGAQRSAPNPGAQEVVSWVKAQNLPVGIITRNSRDSVLSALENFNRLEVADFDLVITRDDSPAVKPSGEGVVWAARQWGLPTAQILTVGDYIFDPQAGMAAGAVTALLDPQSDPHLAGVSCHFRIAGLSELPKIIEAGLK